jgi:TonB family protein
MYRSKIVTLTLVSIFVTCGVVLSATQAKTSDPVNRILEGLNLKRSDVVELCLENCENSQKSSDRITGGGIVTKKKVAHPPIAIAAHASGEVAVLIVISEEGKVIAAQSISGHPLLQAAAVRAARESTFNPYLVDGVPAKVLGTLTYNFVLD